MKTIWFLPLEPLQQRYTEQMYRWVAAALDRLCLPYISITGEAYASIKHGQWLDTGSCRNSARCPRRSPTAPYRRAI
jgi:hypothetical protein